MNDFVHLIRNSREENETNAVQLNNMNVQMARDSNRLSCDIYILWFIACLMNIIEILCKNIYIIKIREMRLIC